MSHHFDTKLAREDPSLNLCDFYLFDGPPGRTAMAMTVNPDVGLSAPDTLHPEGLYAFRFDLNGDAREEVTFKFRFGEPRHGDGTEHTHIQPFVVRKATGDDACDQPYDAFALASNNATSWLHSSPAEIVSANRTIELDLAQSTE